MATRRAVQAGFYRPLGQAGDLSDLLVRQLLHVAQDDQQAVLLGPAPRSPAASAPPARPPPASTSGRSMWDCIGGAGPTRPARAAPPCRPLRVGRRARYLIRFLQWLAATRSSQVENFASPRKPSMVLNTVMKTSWATSSASWRLPEHPVDQAEDLVAVEADDLAERLLVALLEASDEEPLGDAHRVGHPFSAAARAASQTERRLHDPLRQPNHAQVPRASRS